MNRDIDYFNALSYDVLLRKNGTTFSLCIPELSCVVESEDISIAYQKLEFKKNEIFKEMITSDLSYVIQKPERVILNESIIKTLYPFMVKAITVCGVIFFTALATIYVVHDSVKQLAPSGPLALIRNQAAHVKHGLEAMTDDDKKELRLKIRITLLEIKPFLDEFKVLWQESPEKESPEKKSPQ